MDQVLAGLFGTSQAEMSRWMNPGRYLSGRELAETGVAELVDLKTLNLFERNGRPRNRKRVRVR